MHPKKHSLPISKLSQTAALKNNRMKASMNWVTSMNWVRSRTVHTIPSAELFDSLTELQTGVASKS